LETSNKPVAIVLGGTNPHIALIENLKNRGFYTILVDYHENPLAKNIADEHIRESTLDMDKVLKIAIDKKANLVISTCVDQAHVTACYVGEKLGLPIPYSYKCALDISNKTTMKELMRQGNIPTSNFISLNENDEINLKDLKFPLVVKPSDSNGSKGVRRVDCIKELNQALVDAFNISRCKKAIIEEFIDGQEIGVYCFIADKIVHIITMCQKRKPKTNDDSVIYSIGSISPPKISEVIKTKIQDIANQIAVVFNLANTPLLIQLIVNGDDVKVVEFAPRIGGSLSSRKIKLFANFDIIDAAVNSFFNITVHPAYTKPDFLFSETHIYTEPGIFGEIQNYKELVDNQTVVEFYPNKTRGMQIKSGKASKETAGSFFVKGNSIKEIEDKVRKTLNTVKVLDINGCELSFKENYENLLFY
jgi:phosphoribosylamine-glycine ligase